ncbi:MAG: hypothetical protein M3R69_11835 [Acidobacteriota bacterium]|nr:hypothetical protein [Acidobacteriota bacterium]
MASSRKQINEILQRLVSGELSAPTTLDQSGWEMTLSTGERVARSRLQAEAEPLILMGAEAVPDLLPWVMNDNLAARFVALYALEQITGEKPYVSYFDQADIEGHREKAIAVWRAWYDARTK